MGEIRSGLAAGEQYGRTGIFCMGLRHRSLSKITRPPAFDIFPRERLFHLLDEGLGRPVIWVCAPGGSGKTTLVSSYLDARRLPCLWYKVDCGDSDIASFFYHIGMAASKAALQKRKPLPLLTPEYLSSLPLFTQRFFEDFYGRLKSPFIIVFDNYQEVSSQASFHDVISKGLSVIPAGVNVIVISRNEPPPKFARLRANNRIAIVDREDMRLTSDETRNMITQSGQTGISPDILGLVNEKTDGWAAGMVLILEKAKKSGLTPELIAWVTRGGIFDYFASEVFDNADDETKDFLLKTAFLPRVTPAMARKLTGAVNADLILSRLSCDHFFTTRQERHRGSYQYHPLFREFLLARADQIYTPDQVSGIKKNAASLFEDNGNFENSIELFLEAGEWRDAGKLICSHAPTLSAQGRSDTLQGWIEKIPRDIVEVSPYLVYWRGYCNLAVKPAESRKDFELAFRMFRAVNDRTGMFLSWAAAGNVYIHILKEFKTLDNWIAEVEALLQEDPSFPSPEIEAAVTAGLFSAMAVRQPNHPDVSLWQEKTFDLFLQKRMPHDLHLTAGVCLMVYHLWLGNYKKAKIVMTELQKSSDHSVVSDLVLLTIKAANIMYNLFVTELDACISKVYEALALAEEKGIHIWTCHLISHGISAAIGANRMDVVDDLFEKFEEHIGFARSLDRSCYHMLRAWRCMVEGDAESALQYQKPGLDMLMEAGYIFARPVAYLNMVDIFYDRGMVAEALEYLSKAFELGRAMKSKLVEHMCLLREARIHLDAGRQKEGLDSLARAMTLGRENGFVHFISWLPKVMTRLCIEALRTGIEVEYVQDVIRKRNLMPETPPVEVERWPFPFKVYALGEFQIIRESIPVSFEGKVQKMPLIMLKALIAVGGQEVPEERLNDMLWPDAVGDLAHRSFETTLYRLRKLMGGAAAVQLQDGLVSLDKRQWWTDTWAFEKTCSEVDKMLHDNGKCDTEGLLRLSEQATSLYKGDFLPAENHYLWVVSFRQQLKERFLRLLTGTACCLREDGQYQFAIEFYERVLREDSMVEGIYQSLMVCYHRLGLRAEAVRVYNRCRRALNDGMGIAPSAKTETILKVIRG